MVETVNHDGKWTEYEEGEDSNKALAVSFYPRTEPVEPLEWKALENRLKPSSVEPPKLELKELPEHLEYAFLQENNQHPVVISSTLSTGEKPNSSRFFGIIKGQSLGVSLTLKELTNPFLLTKSSWKMSSNQVVPKKGGMTVVKNEKDDLIPQWTVTGWRVCIDYRKLNNATRKDHFPLLFIDQMLERLSGHEYYCFLDRFSGYFQIPIAPEDQEKTIFTCLYETFAYKRMPFGLCNPPATFQHCMTAIFHELLEDSMEVFMDDFSVFGSSFDHCLKNLERMLKRCEETNLVLNWEKCHFMVKEGIVLGHKVSGFGIKVDKAKIKAISKLPYPTNVKAIRSFLGHAGFYRRLIKDFSQDTRPMTQLLVKDAPFNFSKECIQAFDTLKRELTHAPIMIKLDWSLPFEIMYDASNYAIGAVLGQRIDKHFKPIHYTSKTMTKAQENYTTTEKELLFDIKIRDKKGTENLAADHLSRLENPDLGKLTRVEIRDLFLEDQLMAISDKNNEPCMLTESYEDAWLEMKQHKFFNSVKADHSNDTMALAPPIDFMGPFPSSNGNKYILVAIDYVSKWVEAQAFPTSDARNNYQMEKAMKRYGVVHRFSTAYHPQTNGHVKNTNREIKRILKKTIGNNRKDWSYKLDDALWAFRIAFKTTLGTTPFRIIYGKACHLPVELEHKTYRAIKNCNMDIAKVGENRFLQINELDEMRLDAYESSISYKERMKKWHDKRVKLPMNYEKGDKVLLFNSRLRLFPRKLKSRWYGPFTVCKDMKNGAIKLYDDEGSKFIFNKQRVKPYPKNLLGTNKYDDVTFDDEGEVT
ncbi:reverse transcriptase domain-containing protein [Tanacetum coccineum]